VQFCKEASQTRDYRSANNAPLGARKRGLLKMTSARKWLITICRQVTPSVIAAGILNKYIFYLADVA
jgi:hypothetical protein